MADIENREVDDPYIITQYKEIVFAVQYERDHGVPWSKLLRGKTEGGTCTIRRLILGGGTQAMQQLGWSFTSIL